MSGEGITKNMTKIYIVDADTNPSTLTSSDVILGEISNWEQGGGNQNFEYASVFGGKLKRKQDRDEYTLSFDLIFNFEDTARWHEMNLVQHSTGVYVPGDASPKAIFIEAKRGSGYLSLGFNNCDNVSIEISHSAESTREGTIEFTFSHVTDAGIYNYQFKEEAITLLADWSALDSNESS